MCLSRPYRVVAFDGNKAEVEFNNRRKKVKSPFPLKKGDYVLCQVGFVVQKISRSRARGMLKEWKELDGWV